jgi:hypothetical protein
LLAASYGGRSIGIVEQIIFQEAGRIGSPQLVNLLALSMVGPLLIDHGTVAEIAVSATDSRCVEIWCQGTAGGPARPGCRRDARLDGDSTSSTGRRC